MPVSSEKAGEATEKKAPVLGKSGKKICCSCPHTRRPRDECVVVNGEDAGLIVAGGGSVATMIVSAIPHRPEARIFPFTKHTCTGLRMRCGLPCGGVSHCCGD